MSLIHSLLYSSRQESQADKSDLHLGGINLYITLLPPSGGVNENCIKISITKICVVILQNLSIDCPEYT